MKKQQLEQRLAEADETLRELNRNRKMLDDELQNQKLQEQNWQRAEVSKASRLQSIQSLIVPLKMQEEDLHFEIKDSHEYHLKLEREAEEMRKEVDILIHQFLIAERLSQDEVEKVKKMLDERKENE